MHRYTNRSCCFGPCTIARCASCRPSDPVIRAFTFAQRVTAACAASTVDEAIRTWASCYAFVEAGADARLTLPDTAARIEWRDNIPAPANYWTLLEPGGAAIAAHALNV